MESTKSSKLNTADLWSCPSSALRTSVTWTRLVHDMEVTWHSWAHSVMVPARTPKHPLTTMLESDLKPVLVQQARKLRLKDVKGSLQVIRPSVARLEVPCLPAQNSRHAQSSWTHFFQLYQSTILVIRESKDL